LHQVGYFQEQLCVFNLYSFLLKIGLVKKMYIRRFLWSLSRKRSHLCR